MRVGYACLNITLAAQDVQVNRSMIKKTFVEKGISYASRLALANVTDLEKVVHWNLENGFYLYRMSSDMFPWMSEYEIADLPDYASIRQVLERIGAKALRHGLRLTFHPGPFNVLASPDANVVTKTVKELRQHGEIMDLLKLPRSPFAKINIHIGGAYGNRAVALRRFIDNFQRLPETVASRLTVENDDKVNMFSVADLIQVHEATGSPIVFDFHHHAFRSSDLTVREALELAIETWPRGVPPVVHYSNSRKKYEDVSSHDASHADYLYEPLNLYGARVDIMLEAKAKEKAGIRFLDALKAGKFYLNNVP